ncbi:unnamed protein product [Rotaria sordida]|uniref:Uncharacterized protein n=1 Tax=Rotaria sordida TaxID=392033 RepID=A0A819V6K7_9BILA|nr:unnamed protein product [Rotaria sordida]CAF4104335.1 unnamed protein product [Rotaria sordida]
MASKPTDCGGVACPKCHKCADWKYTGDKKTWKWITEANDRGWPRDDLKRWNDNIRDRFQRHHTNGNCVLSRPSGGYGYHPSANYVVYTGGPDHICWCN